MADISVLSRKRRGKKRTLSDFKVFLDILDIKAVPPNVIVEIEERVANVEGNYDEFVEIQSNIEDICQEDQLEQEYSERTNFVNEYYSLLARAKFIVQSNRVTGSGDGIGFVNNIKLPTIQLPAFSGSLEAWMEYKDIFTSIIHSNSNICNSQKLHYLKSTLTGHAAQLIKSLEVTEANYIVAWQLLCERYDNKKILVNNHLKALFSLPAVKNDSAFDLRKLLDEFSKHTLALAALGQKVNDWHTILIYLISNKLDLQTQREWEVSKYSKEFPEIEELKIFIKNKCDVLETLENQNKRTYTKTTTLISTNKRSCSFCGDDHLVYFCEELMNLSVQDRIKLIKEKRLCLNCLKGNHVSYNCTHAGCRKCNKKHNTLLHLDKQESVAHDRILVNCNGLNSNILLSTSEVRVESNFGKSIKCRALLDCGSEGNFVTYDVCDQLGLKKIPIKLSVIGINQKESAIKYKTHITLKSLNSAFSRIITCFVINKITDNIPFKTYDMTNFSIPDNLQLSDIDFNKSRQVDILLGANIFWDLLCPEQIKLGKGKPIIQNTRLGWIISGPFRSNENSQKVICNFATGMEVQDTLKRFWEIEECSDVLVQDNSYCEKYFKSTTKSDSTGKLIVSIPFKESKLQLGDSFEIARIRFKYLERKLQINKGFREQYIEFMREYANLGHMSEIEKPLRGIGQSYYLPHHGVLKNSSLTTKLRVVFDGSCKTSTGISLNDTQYTGPTIQDELLYILLRFRLHKYILSADIEKMYRQVLIDVDQRDYQRILWREDPNAELKHYTLNTVTYGTTSAPYLAIRALHEAAYIHKNMYKNASQIILRDFYVDDLLTGTDTIEEAITLYNELNIILTSVGFKLRQWVTNDMQIQTKLNSVAQERHSILNLELNDNKRTLGLIWLPKTDKLTYDICSFENNEFDTKRIVLSHISKVFDPLGLLGPCIIIAKMLLQEIWIQKLNWDDKLPLHISERWRKLKRQLKCMSDVTIPRYALDVEFERLELHAFSDASEAAYGTCIYIRIITKEKVILTNLLCAKSKVTPLKKLTIPRLELCAALLSTRLVKKVLAGTNLKFDAVYYWSDSTIVLNWLHTYSNNLKIFVAHRIAEMQENCNINNWFYVSTKNNPADLISRGVYPEQLKNSIWWSGPHWLSTDKENWPQVTFKNMKKDLPELKIVTTALIVTTDHSIFPFNYTNSLTKLKNVTAYCLRFINNIKQQREKRQYGILTVTELNYAMKRLVRLAQGESFGDVISYLHDKEKLNLKANIIQLSPFLDTEGLIRVGGRLKNSDFEIDKKHPLLLCGKHNLTKLILESEHLRLLHGGPHLMLSSIRVQYWPIGGRNLVKSIVNKCIKCFKVKPRSINPFMGNLPKVRLTATYPFNNVGVDYAGPFQIKRNTGRGSKTFKSYLCLFICLSTKAIHLEPVTELTSDAFIATFRRFVARRGRPSNLFSDNGTNFVGAVSKLDELGKFLKTSNRDLSVAASKENVRWNFSPAYSPHFGGIWEAGVKSSKHHLRRVLGNTLITFEDFLTVLVQIESILNSRPLCPLSPSPNDYEALTPSHFLIGRNSMRLPDPDVTDVSLNRLSRYQHIQQIQQHFWQRWSLEYISELQIRTRWLKEKKTQVEIGQLVLIKEDNLPPLRWKLARIHDVHPGTDGIIRVVSLTTPSGVVKRAVGRICILPNSEDADEEGR